MNNFRTAERFLAINIANHLIDNILAYKNEGHKETVISDLIDLKINIIVPNDFKAHISELTSKHDGSILSNYVALKFTPANSESLFGFVLVHPLRNIILSDPIGIFDRLIIEEGTIDGSINRSEHSKLLREAFDRVVTYNQSSALRDVLYSVLVD